MSKQSQVIEAARKKFPTAKSFRVVESTCWPIGNLGPTRAELWTVFKDYTTSMLTANDLPGLIAKIEEC